MLSKCVATKELQKYCQYRDGNKCTLTVCLYYHDDDHVNLDGLESHLTAFELNDNICKLYFDNIAPKTILLNNYVTLKKMVDFIQNGIDDTEPYTNYERLLRVNSLHKANKGQLLGRIINIEGEQIQIELKGNNTTYTFNQIVEYMMLYHNKPDKPQYYLTNPSKLKGLYSRESIFRKLEKEWLKENKESKFS